MGELLSIMEVVVVRAAMGRAPVGMGIMADTPLHVFAVERMVTMPLLAPTPLRMPNDAWHWLSSPQPQMKQKQPINY